jgi:acetylornithine deacetylase/succinyl-diaminopimelate desuccinylase-like protein
VVQQLRSHVARVAPRGVAVEVLELHGGAPGGPDPEGFFFEAAREALEEAFGVEPVLTGEGGSIPIVTEFERILGAGAILLGFALPGCQHARPRRVVPRGAPGEGDRDPPRLLPARL